ncbi:MAG: SpoIIE family protein phosphatase [Acidobacteria bacterium]|nr:SpoIIE family protein phosphatase [Acidobacteriota bacterium]
MSTSTATERAMPSVLIADDQHTVLEALRMLLKTQGYHAEMVSSPGGLLAALESGEFDVVLLDLNYTLDTTSGQEGLELLSRIQALDENLPLVVMTAWGSMDLAIEAMRRGASDFIQKPWDNQQVLHTLQRQIERRRKNQAERRQVELETEQIGELKEIHQHLFPREMPQVPGIDIAADTRAFREVGGDFFHLEKCGNRLAVAIADVAGKGLPAALLMANLQGTIKPLMALGSAPARTCAKVNGAICDVTVLGKFIALFYAVIDPGARTLTFCNAGHNPALLIREDGSSERLSAGGAVLGHFPNWEYSEHTVKFDPGDRLLLFTDGINEACNHAEEDFGEERLAELTRRHAGAGASALLEAIMQSVTAHCCGKFQDDATLVVLSAR